MSEVKERVNPDEAEQLDEIVRNSYNHFVRLERRNLLLVSSLTLFAAITGVSPHEGRIFGFSFTNLNEEVIYLVFSVLIAYFLAAFLIYSVPNFREASKAREKIKEGIGVIEYSRPWYSIVSPNITGDTRYFLWYLIHFLLPIFIGVAAFVVAIFRIV